jgi:ribosomal protein L37AE/L43A
MSEEVKRAAELWLCAELTRLVKGPAWYPSNEQD